MIMVEDMQERLVWLLGDQLKEVTDKTIVIIGLGGVGSYCLETLARTGIHKLILADHDIVDISNLNRQVMTLQSNVGQDKVRVWKERIHDINPNIVVIPYKQFITEENLEVLFQEKIDYCVDACDSVTTKEAIIRYCLKHKIPFISSMGMANRIDSSKVKISTLDKTKNDPLAKKLRIWAKKNNIKGKIPVVYSDEVPKKGKNLGSIAHVPATAGLLITNYIINSLLKENVCKKN